MEVNNTDIKQIVRKTFLQAIKSLDENYAGSSLTDVFIVLDKNTGELTFYDDEDNSIADVVIFSWVDKPNLKDSTVISVLREITVSLNEEHAFDSLDIYKPFSVNYSNENFEIIEELLLLNDESLVELDMDNSLMDKFDREFDEFLDRLMRD